ncbi:MAG: hypothetical protein JWO57_1841 [Pseudonocardiales bacterium]|nr:hypothetical protein [Pseudonocardiales bacterium]
MTGPRIVPESTELTAAFWSAAAEGRILLQRCAGCELVWHPPAPVCPGCRGDVLEWFASSGRGTLYSYTRVEHAAHAAVADAVPYLVALVDLDEGPRVVTSLVGVDDASAVSALTARTRVTIELGPAAAGLQLPIARPSGPDADGSIDPAPPA